MLRRIAIVVALVAGSFHLSSGVGVACSCAAGDPRDSLAASDAAFIGVLIHREEPTPDRDGMMDSGQKVTYRFKVNEAVKGQLGETVDVESSADGASCGIETTQGREIGLLLYRRGDHWSSGLCSKMDPDELRKAAQPLAPPDGEGALTFLIGGSFGEMRTLGLDARGRTLYYGEGNGETLRVAVCPGSRFAVEIIGKDGGPRFRSAYAIRDLDTFEVTRTADLSEFDVPKDNSLRASAVACRDSQAADVLVFGSNVDSGERRTVARLVRIRADSTSIVWEGKAGYAAVSTSGVKAYIGTRGEIVEVDIDSRQTRQVAKLPNEQAWFNLSPKGTHLAGRATIESSHHKGFVTDVASGHTRQIDFGEDVTGGPRELIWVGNDRLIAYTGGGDTDDVSVFDRSLTKLASWEGWDTTSAFVVGDTIFGAGWGTVSSAPYLTGPAKVMRKFDSPETFAFVHVPPQSPDPAPKPTPSPEPTASPEPSTDPSPAPLSPAPFAQSYSQPTNGARFPLAATGGALGVAAAGLAMAYTRRRS